MSHKAKKIKEKKSVTHTKTFKGFLDISKSGMGFVIVEGLEKDILVRPNNFGSSFHVDLVRVEVPKYSQKEKRAEGKIIDVIQRKKVEFIGRMQVTKTTAFFIPSNETQLPDFFIPMNQLNGAVDGDKVVAELVSWEKSTRSPEGKVISVIDASSVGDMAMKEILIEEGFPLAFEPDVIEAAEKLSGEITDKELKKRKDFRGKLTFTIDPVDAKDFDDAISFEKLANGNFEIGVHIADVSHFVQPDSLLDKTAYERATSVYLPDRVNPMLPEKISNELCSLRPDEDKYSFSAVFEITPTGKIKNKWIGRTVIRSVRRYSYEEAQTIIETGVGDHSEVIQTIDQLAKIFRKERMENGAINFSSQEVRFVLDEKGTPIGVVIKESKDANKLIEEFMLLANRIVAEYASKQKFKKEAVPFPYRVHDEPNEEKLAPFVAFARKFGYTFDMKDEKTIASSFNNLLKEIQGRPEQHVLEQLGIRTMAKAVYTTENVGHYGLGFENYCHFTSPIRRYPDVMVHRVIQQMLDNEIVPDKKMEDKCKHCSERERSAMEAERAGNKFKQVEFMSKFLGEDFDAVVSGVSAFGFWAETVEQKCEGMVNVRDLVSFDEFRLDEVDYQLVGMRTGKKFRIGDKVRIKVVAASLEKRKLDYHYIPTTD